MMTRRTFLARSVAATAVVMAAPLVAEEVAEEVPVIDVMPHFADPTLPIYGVMVYQKIWLAKRGDMLEQPEVVNVHVDPNTLCHIL